ncbi:glycine, glutamate and proline-rich protein-like [Physella acuta]|uniref:glycine, glutamate and proline-rich protein-like n=1 Tax=Physella acuta TaxID=109671 RepID=UPI0027DB2106|nr:glycine, glutamate and proline-rich protein-like [Physella acuta]
MFVLLLCALLAVTDVASRTCNGDVTKLNPTGSKIGGVADSNKQAEIDVPALTKQLACYQASADANCIQASVIAAIASRESRGGTLLINSYGYSSNGAYGIMQCDSKSGLPCNSVPWNSCAHIEMMVNKLLVPYITKVRSKLTSWTKDQALQGGVAAYNFGVKNVWTWSGVDVGTTGGDYSNDVIARAKWLYSKGWN